MSNETNETIADIIHEMREMANAVDDVSINYNGEYYYEKHDKFNPDLVRDMLLQAADAIDRQEKKEGEVK